MMPRRGIFYLSSRRGPVDVSRMAIPWAARSLKLHRHELTSEIVAALEARHGTRPGRRAGATRPLETFRTAG